MVEVEINRYTMPRESKVGVPYSRAEGMKMCLKADTYHAHTTHCLSTYVVVCVHSRNLCLRKARLGGF